MKAVQIDIDWHPGLSIYASESFLKSVGDEYGWIGGIDDSGKLRCILPYTIIRKAIFRMVRFRIETIPLGEYLELGEEQAFLNSAIEYLRSIGADMIIPATTNTIFRTYPNGAAAAPYGSCIIDLGQAEDTLWSNISKTYRKNIRSAINTGVHIQSGIEYTDIAYRLVRNTFSRSGIRFMRYDAFQRLVAGLGQYVKILVADYKGVVQSCTVFPFSPYSAYALYGGSIIKPVKGAMKLLQWEAIRMFNGLGIQQLDFVGARINAEKGSKQEGIFLFKQHFGARLVQGYMWKYPFHSLKYFLYCLAVRLLRRGNIVDQERHKIRFAHLP
jgi:lipid II:glycine glycyltransferase (peptidoglycan interpeptide bridge formation enzyme)